MRHSKSKLMMIDVVKSLRGAHDYPSYDIDVYRVIGDIIKRHKLSARYGRPAIFSGIACVMMGCDDEMMESWHPDADAGYFLQMAAGATTAYGWQFMSVAEYESDGIVMQPQGESDAS